LQSIIDCETESLSAGQSERQIDPIILLREEDEGLDRNSSSSRKNILYSSDANEFDYCRSVRTSGVSAVRNVSKLRSKFPSKTVPNEFSQFESKFDSGEVKLNDSCASFSGTSNKDSDFIGSISVNNFSKVRNRLQAARDETYFLDDDIR
jgi:hypothetical protein